MTVDQFAEEKPGGFEGVTEGLDQRGFLQVRTRKVCGQYSAER